MAKQEIRVSDFNGRQFRDEDEVITIVVDEHPDLLNGKPVKLEVFAEEVGAMRDFAISVVRFRVYYPGDAGGPRFVTAHADDFDALAPNGDMPKVLAQAEPAAAEPAKAGKSKSSSKRSASGIDYATLEHCGEPHQGRKDPKEVELVRANLAAVNERLARDGFRLIDPRNPEHRQQFGLTEPDAEAMVTGATRADVADSEVEDPGSS
jgi:hypothetical protein